MHVFIHSFIHLIISDLIPLSLGIVKPDAISSGSVDAILDAIRGEGIEILARRKMTLTPEDVAQLHGGEPGCCGGGEDSLGSGELVEIQQHGVEPEYCRAGLQEKIH